MADKLSQSLDEILSTRRAKSTRGRGRNVRGKATKAVAAPVGGVKKAVKSDKPAEKRAPTGPRNAGAKDSKIIVSNLVCEHRAVRKMVYQY
jgi:hypothetical protein